MTSPPAPSLPPDRALLVEACIDSVADAFAAEASGAGRLELCANLDEGGTTPSIGMVRALLARVRVPVYAIIRPRGGDFLYSADEIEVMLRDIEAAKAAGVHGIVSGALHANGVIDEDGTRALIEAGGTLPFTFHRAIDYTRDLQDSLDTCLALGVTRVLTSGGAATAVDGSDVILAMKQRAGTRLTVMAGGGVRAANVRKLVDRTGVSEIHMGPRRTRASGMQLRTSQAKVAKHRTSPFDWTEFDDAELRSVMQQLGTKPAPVGT